MSTLDDFFAKKDRKKKGGRSSDFASKADKIDQNSEDKVVDITEKFKYINHTNDEWLDFEENRDKDYSGLKIQTFSNKDKTQLLQEQKLAESIEEGKDHKPWAVVEEEAKVVEEVQEVKEVKEVKDVPQKYIPPSLRTTVSVAPKKIGMITKAPELGNKSEFPTLG